ncbi:uncharacterized protein PV09_02672 [Verruconis gallopava]|uniref:Uncharacterized protein n=1 Tax=Verruconis gallopava TaxID=253628 RepID=A0A0D1YZQ6_9PEZI|nr:uncharacterized protein PV09_02672 [Verruconis gallopava]KIW06192.1 hypothetical protein PV09_02672 [Verruconis gallopava]
MSDLHPNIDSWMETCSYSQGYLSYIPQSVDATDPPMSVISTSAKRSRTAEGFQSDSKIFRLYCLSFHHFDDRLAKKVLESTMETADGFAIIELQDRFLSSFALMLGHIPLIYVTSIFRYYRDIWMLILIYVLPIVPIINTFDGLVSCLRTRSFKEVMALIGTVPQERGSSRFEKIAFKDDWVFRSAYEIHSRPVGYMNWIAGHRRSDMMHQQHSSTPVHE